MSTLSADSPKRKTVVAVLFVFWLLAVIGAMATFMRWETTPGAKGVWTGAAPAVKKRWQLLMVAHTMCPCTRASLEELRSLLAKKQIYVAAKIVFTGPDADRESAANVKLARSIPDLELEFCQESEAVAKFHAKVSGQTFLFDPNGRVRFSGGLTATRGELDPSSGVDAIGRILAGSPENATAPTFGCALQTSR